MKKRAAVSSQEKFTIEQAFNFFYGPADGEQYEAINEERAVRAVAFLLTYGSDLGNRSLDGNAANGLARVLEVCAGRIAFVKKSPEMRLEVRSLGRQHGQTAL